MKILSSIEQLESIYKLHGDSFFYINVDTFV